MSIMKKHILLLFVVICSYAGQAQQDPQFTHYMYNTIYVNPAYAGSRDALTVGLINRNQWIGLDGAPNSQTLYAHTPLRNEALNLGFSLVNDKIGPIQQSSFNVDFAYRFKLTEELRLAFGLKGGMKLFQPRLAGLITTDPDDPDLVGADVQNTWNPNIGFGAYLNHDRWYVGIGMPKIIETKIATVDGENRDIRDKRHYFFIAGAMLPINDMISLKPTTQVKVTANAPVSVDLTLEALLREKFSVGLAHRFNDSFSVLAGVMVTEQLRAGISWDFTTSNLNQANNGTLEFMLQYDFMFKNDKLKSPRYF
jgi:type IX secretion system PorP/SprF family membrane protein